MVKDRIKNIVLVGFMGTGKTSVGVRLAEMLKMQFVDTDDLIEKESGMSISDMFSQKGEDYFRDRESSIIEKVSKLGGQVIATGGGAVKREENVNNLRANGIIFCLHASPEVILQRTSSYSHRPLLQVDDPISKIQEMLKEREPFYDKADYRIDTSQLTLEQVVDKIQSIFMEAKMTEIKSKIIALAEKYSMDLKKSIDKRITEMESDDNSHYLIYNVLGITDDEGKLIDQYQNQGRFLYKYAGSFLEEATILCFEEAFPDAKRKVKIANKLGSRPKTFEIDCLIGNDAIEIKWRDATTDGDHITKEHTRLRNIKNAGYCPIRVMFYNPNREQAIRIQEALEAIYAGIGGKYYSGEDAWSFVNDKTNIDLKSILEEIAEERVK
jgi:shikimate kinase